MQKYVWLTLISSIGFLICSDIYCQKKQFKKTHPFYFELFLSRSNDASQAPIIGLIKKRDGTFGGFRKRGIGEDGDITIRQSQNGDAFVTAKKLYDAVSSKIDSRNLWVTTISGIKVQLNRELVSALRDPSVLSKLYVLTQEHQQE